MPTDGTDRSPARTDGGSADDDGSGDEGATTEAAAATGDDAPADEPTPDRVVEVAAEAAEDVVFARIDRGDVADLDVTVSFEEGILEVDVFVEAPESREDEGRVADDAAMAARSAVDDLF